MIPKENEKQIVSIAEDILEEFGMRLYDIQFNHVAMMIRIFIDRESGSVTIADCKKVNQKISHALDRITGNSTSYSLEVSSPGIERQLKRPEHFVWAKGKMVEVNVGKEKKKGYLRNSRSDGIVIATKSGEQFIAYNTIIKAKVVEDMIYDKRR